MVERPGENFGSPAMCARRAGARPGPARAPARAADRRIASEQPYGSRRVFELRQATASNRKRVQKPMRVMGDRGAVRAPAHKAPGHKIYPYLLRGVSIRPNHVWASGTTQFRALALHRWQLSTGPAGRLWRGAVNTMDTGFASRRSTKRWRGTARQKYQHRRPRTSAAPAAGAAARRRGAGHDGAATGRQPARRGGGRTHHAARTGAPPRRRAAGAGRRAERRGTPRPQPTAPRAGAGRRRAHPGAAQPQNEELRKYLKAVTEKAWPLVNWLTHNATRRLPSSLRMRSTQFVKHYVRLLSRAR